MFIANLFVKNWLLQFRINKVRNSNSEILTCCRLQKSAGLVFFSQPKLQHGDEGSLFIWFVTAVDVTPMSKQVGHKKSCHSTAQSWKKKKEVMANMESELI